MQTRLMVIALLGVLPACFSLKAAIPAKAPSRPIRIAMMPFTTDDNSYRSSLAAADLATVLQAELSAEPGFEWIERTELKAVEREFELSELGLPDAVGALRRGKIAAADWIVSGCFTASNSGPWELTIEVIDVAHADRLAQRRATVPRVSHPTLKSALPQSQRVASEIRTTLAGALERWRSMIGRRTVALLSLIDAGEIETDLARRLEAFTNGLIPVRVMQVRETGLSSTETEMMLLGLVDHHPAAWEHLADIYVWGRFVRRERPILELSVWDGRGEPEVHSIPGEQHGSRDSVLRDILPRAAEEVARACEIRRGTNRSEAVRKRIAQALFVEAKALYRGPDRWIEDIYAQVDIDVRQQARLLETACFFDPQNQSAHELLLRVWWRPGPYRFWHVLKRSEAWGAYVDRFGLTSALPRPYWELGPRIDDGAVDLNYIWSVVQLVQLAQTGNKEDFGFPRDMSEYAARKWLGGFATEMAQRVVKSSDRPNTKSCAPLILKEGLTGSPMGLVKVEANLRLRCIEALWPAFVARQGPGSREEDFHELCASIKATYAEAGLAGKETALFRQLNKPKVQNQQTPVRLPKAAELDRLPPAGPPR